MEFAIVVVFLLLFLGGCVAAVIFAWKRRGGGFVVRYLLIAFLVRVLMRGLTSASGQAQTILVPLLAAAAIMWMWPHIVTQRMREREEPAKLGQEETNEQQ